MERFLLAITRSCEGPVLETRGEGRGAAPNTRVLGPDGERAPGVRRLEGSQGMRRLKILLWHVHGSYLNVLGRVDQDWYLPVKPGSPDGYSGRAGYDLPDFVHDVPADRVGDLDLDLVLFQTPQNYLADQYDILRPEQRQLPQIYLEHNTPRPHAVDSRHPVDDPTVLLVHVTHFNRLMWDNGRTPTTVVEHSVAIDANARYTGHLERGVTVVNGMQRRPRIAGYDLFLTARAAVPLDAVGMQTEEFGGLGDISYPVLHRRVAGYRFLFSPMRYTSLPLAVIEAMMVVLPIVALATTELPTVIANGETGFISCQPDELIDRMRYLLANPAEARRMGDNARQVAQARFGFDRFSRDWQAAFARALELRDRPV
jgi:hypothetical protein